ncbi:hypothetical protein LIER_25906 [Lithospermum erythrorhizon]|uniref:F-box domain-containing protein n=1 Tax=Lithospermum erythrorhizon TaxID=34254 RepID=A0AAV3RAI1_LITER
MAKRASEQLTTVFFFFAHKEQRSYATPERKNKESSSSTSTLKPVPPPPPPWVELPEDIMANILRKIGSNGLLRSAQEVCSTWRMICRDPAMWRVIDMWKLGDDYEFSIHGYNVLCRHAVDLSQGQVTECNIEGFLTDDLLEYIVERCGQLRCLRLLHCDISVPPPPPPWVELPVDITANILRKIGSNGLLRSAQEVCSTWRMIYRDLAMWRVIDMWKLGDDYEFSVHGYNVLCRHAVDLRQGQVIECNIEGLAQLYRNLVQTKKHICYNWISELVKLALFLPVATVSVERVFSTMKYVKNEPRNRMEDP